MEIFALNPKQLAALAAAAARELALEPGSELVARVVSLGPAPGRGVLSMAGLRVDARLPEGLAAGQKLALTVVRADAGQLVVRIQGEAGGPTDPQLVRLAGQLAVTGDGDLLRAALHLAGGEALRLAGGDAATVEIDPDDSGAAGNATAGEAAFVLHSPTLGAIEVRLRIAPGAIRAGVVTAPGRAAAIAEAELGNLVERLAHAAGRPAAAVVNPRPPGRRAPPPPGGGIDVQA